MRCFVISPIGEEGSRDRQHVDAVWDRLISPAVEHAQRETKVSVDAKKEYRNYKARAIIDDIIRRILVDEVLIAILDGDDHSGTNPNVMYELGIAHSAGRNVILLRDESRRYGGTNIFDIQQHHKITYDAKDLHANNVSERVRDIADAIILQIEDARHGKNGGLRVAFGNENLDALGSRHRRFQLLSKVVGQDPIENLTFERWASILSEAQEFIGVSGVSLYQLLDRSDSFELSSGRRFSFAELLMSKLLADGVKVQLLIMDEHNPALKEMLRGHVCGDRPSQIDIVQEEIRQATKEWKRMERNVAAVSEDWRGSGVAKIGSLELVKARRGFLNGRLTITDKAIIITPIFLQEIRNGSGPALIATSCTTTYSFYRAHFDFLVEHNRRLAEEGATADRTA